MALESIGKRSIRNEYDHAGGDNLLQMSQKKFDFEHKKEDDQLNVEMVEGESFAEHQHSGEKRYFGGLIGNKELVIISSLAVCTYLVNGEYAQSLCTILTSVPPAIFSYRVSINQQTNAHGLHTILFYWTLYGLITLIDQFVGTAQGYNLCKGGLLSVVFLHAVRSNSAAIPSAWKFMDQATTDILTTIFSHIEFEGVSPNKEFGFVPKTPTMTQFTDDSLQYIFPESENFENAEMDISTAYSFLPSLEMQSTQNESPGYMHKTKTVTPKTMKIEEEKVSGRISTQNTPQINFHSMSAMTMTCGSSADIVTIPADHITFTENSREEAIRVSNVSPLHIMFALKTNADTYLIAAPTSGVLFIGQSMTIRVGVTDKYFDDYSDPGVSIDKLAIDYCLIPGSSSSTYSKFSLNFFQSQNRRRLAIRIFYE